MPKKETIRREMRRLRKIMDDQAMPEQVRREAYGMVNALQWALGGCTWRPSTVVVPLDFGGPARPGTQEKER